MAEQNLRPELQQIERDYQRDVTVLSARPKILQAGLLLWTLVDVALIIFFIVNVIVYIVSGSFTEQREIASIAANAGVANTIAQARMPESLVVDEVKILSRGDATYDLYATVENPNDDWIATLTYVVEYGQDAPKEKEAVILPMQEQYLLELNAEASSRPSGAELVVKDVTWERVDRHEVTDIPEFLTEHANFVVQSAEYAADVTVEQESIARSMFTVKNATPYTYYEPTFVVLLKKGSVISGINQVVVPQFVASQTREVEVHWFGAVPTSGSLELIPVINYFDKSAYSAPSGADGTDRRDDVRR